MALFIYVPTVNDDDDVGDNVSSLMTPPKTRKALYALAPKSARKRVGDAAGMLATLHAFAEDANKDAKVSDGMLAALGALRDAAQFVADSPDLADPLSIAPRIAARVSCARSAPANRTRNASPKQPPNPS